MTKILTPAEVAEIKARLEDADVIYFDSIPALCHTIAALRAENERLRGLLREATVMVSLTALAAREGRISRPPVDDWLARIDAELDEKANNKTCETCRWWHRQATDPENGECRYDPPPIIWAMMDAMTAEPAAHIDHRKDAQQPHHMPSIGLCSEHTPREPERADG